MSMTDGLVQTEFWLGLLGTVNLTSLISSRNFKENEPTILHSFLIIFTSSVCRQIIFQQNGVNMLKDVGRLPGSTWRRAKRVCWMPTTICGV
jgi:hypothetical protein